MGQDEISEENAETENGKNPKTKLYQTPQQLTPNVQKKVTSIWRYVELFKLIKQYDKTEFLNHARRVMEVGKLYEKCSTIHKSFTDIEADIETTHNMSILMKDEIDKCKASGNAAAIEVATSDYEENEQLLGRNNALKKEQIRAFMGILDEWEFPKISDASYQ